MSPEQRAYDRYRRAVLHIRNNWKGLEHQEIQKPDLQRIARSRLKHGSFGKIYYEFGRAYTLHKDKHTWIHQPEFDARRLKK